MNPDRHAVMEYSNSTADFIFPWYLIENYTNGSLSLEPEGKHEVWRDIPLGLVLSLLSLLTFIGNAMVLHAVRTERRLQTVSRHVYIGKYRQYLLLYVSLKASVKFLPLLLDTYISNCNTFFTKCIRSFNFSDLYYAMSYSTSLDYPNLRFYTK